MIIKIEKAQCCLLLAKTLYQFRMCTKLIVWYLIMGYKPPWVLQYLEQWKKMGIGYPFVLAAVLNCHESIWIMIQYRSQHCQLSRCL